MVGAATAVLLSGCASLEWRRPYNDTEEAFRADADRCRYEVELGYGEYQAGPAMGMGGAIGSGLAAGLGDAVRKGNLRAMCLESKGWRKERIR